MNEIITLIEGIDWGIVLRRILYGAPVALLVVLACGLIMSMSSKVGHRKLDYVYATEEEREEIRQHDKAIRRRVEMCVFWLTLGLMYLLQYVIDVLVGL